jgi:hypothetical protein
MGRTNETMRGKEHAQNRSVRRRNNGKGPRGLQICRVWAESRMVESKKLESRIREEDQRVALLRSRMQAWRTGLEMQHAPSQTFNVWAKPIVDESRRNRQRSL